MNIPKEVLSEKNYSGTRLIEITNPLVNKYVKEITKIQVEKLNPLLNDAKYKSLTSKMDVLYSQIGQLNDKLKQLKLEVEPIRAEYDVFAEKMLKLEQKAQLIKNKIQPIIDSEISGKLGEFEKPLHAKEKNGKIYVEIQDEIEETVKNIRARKTKK